MKRTFLVLAGLAAFTLLLYIADSAWLQVRSARHREVHESLQIQIVYQIPQKGSKAEYIPQLPEIRTCIRSIFPHAGEPPCWYLRRHTEQQVNF